MHVHGRTEPTAKHQQRGQKIRVRWNNFTIVGERAILRASGSTQDPRFKPMNRGRQGRAACMVAIALAHLIEPCDWTSELLDRVLEYADRLFRVSRARALLPTQALLHPEQLQPEFFIGDYKCTLCTESNKFTGNLSSDALGATNIYNALTTFLRDHDFGILISQGMNIDLLLDIFHRYLVSILFTRVLSLFVSSFRKIHISSSHSNIPQFSIIYHIKCLLRIMEILSMNFQFYF